MKKRSHSVLRIVSMVGAFFALLPFSARARRLKAGDMAPAVHSISGPGPASIHFELADSLIYVQASLNGSEPLWMVLDTGSSVTVLDESKSKTLRLKSSGKGRAYGPGQGSSQKLAFASHATLRFADTELGNQTVAALPLDWFSRAVGRGADGFLGSSLFRRFVVEIDYANQELRLYDPSTYSYSGAGQRVPLQFTSDNIPRIRADVITPEGASITGTFLVDTGSTTGFWLTKEFSDAHPELFPMEKMTEVASVTAVGGEIRSRAGQVPALRLGDFIIERPTARFSQNTSGLFAMHHLAGIIGAEVLSRFTVIFDYPHRQMILEPNAHFGDPDGPERNDQACLTAAVGSMARETVRQD